MRKIILPLVILAVTVSCKKEESSNATLEALIKNKDIKGLQAYKEKEKAKLDSINNLIANIDGNLTSFGVNTAVAGHVSVQKLEPTVFAHDVELQGNVTTDQDVVVQPQFAGTLSLFVKEGQRVGRGQVIGRVADGGLKDQYQQALNGVTALKAQVGAAQTQANLAKVAYEKQASLWKQNIGSEFQYLQSKASYEAAVKNISGLQSQVNGAQKAADAVKANLAKTAIVAPFSGVIDEVMTQNGQVVAPGTPVVKLISLGVMRVEAKVPEVFLAKVRPGTSVDVFFPTLNKTVKSSVRLVGNSIDPVSRTFVVQIPVPNEGGVIKPNLLAQLKIRDYVNPSAIQMPSQYIYQDATGKDYVFVAQQIKGKEAVAKKVYVGIGEKASNSVEISTGLKTGDVVILDGSKNLTDGQKVKIGA